MNDKTEAQREVAMDIRGALRHTFPGTYPGNIYVSPEGEMSFQYQGRQIIIRIAAAR